MTILFAGNICNYAYWYAAWGQMLGYDTHALIEDNVPYDRDNPEWEDPSFDRGAPPPWVHYYSARWSETTYRPWVDPRVPHLLDEFEHVHTFSVTMAMLVHELRGGLIHHTVGSFQTGTRWRGTSARSMVSPRRLALVSRFRAAMKGCSRIVVSTPIEYNHVARSRFVGKMVALPTPYDVHSADGHVRTPPEAPDARLRVVMPARQNWVVKGQHLVLRALASLDDDLKSRVEVLAFDWGSDVQRTKDLAMDLGLADQITWGPILRRDELLRTLGGTNVLAVVEFPVEDQGPGGLGGVARDAMAVGAPVMTFARPEAARPLHRTPPPILHAEPDVPDIAARLSEVLAMSPGELFELGAKGREWLEEECGLDRTIPRYVALHEAAGGAA